MSRGLINHGFIPNYKRWEMSPWQKVKVGTGRSLRTDLAQAGAATLSMVLLYYYYPTILVAILLLSNHQAAEIFSHNDHR